MLPPWPRQRGLGPSEPNVVSRHILDRAPEGAGSSPKPGRRPSPLSKNYQRASYELAPRLDICFEHRSIIRCVDLAEDRDTTIDGHSLRIGEWQSTAPPVAKSRAASGLRPRAIAARASNRRFLRYPKRYPHK